jgi:hypothetical protein
VAKSGHDVLFTQEMDLNKIVGAGGIAPTIVQIQRSQELEGLNNANP